MVEFSPATTSRSSGSSNSVHGCSIVKLTEGSAA